VQDAGSYTNERDNAGAVNNGAAGSDGSLMLDKFEFLQPEDRYDAFALYVRTVRSMCLALPTCFACVP
jgi:hypothetical protein